MAEDIIRSLGYLTLGTRLKRLGERLQADTQRILEEHNLEIPAGQFPFLAAIDRLGPLTIGDLAQSIGLTQPGATRTVKQLEAEGLLAVVPSSDDQRHKRVNLTAKGKRLVTSAKNNTWPLIESAVQDLCQVTNDSILEQLTLIEDELSGRPLIRRITAIQEKR